MSDLSEVTEQLRALADEQRARWVSAEARLRAAQGTPQWDDVAALLAELDNARYEREAAQRHHLRVIGERDALAAEHKALRASARGLLTALEFSDPDDDEDEDEINTAAGELDALLRAGSGR